jgi:hypothetical protein
MVAPRGGGIRGRPGTMAPGTEIGAGFMHRMGVVYSVEILLRPATGMMSQTS